MSDSFTHMSGKPVKLTQHGSDDMYLLGVAIEAGDITVSVNDITVSVSDGTVSITGYVKSGASYVTATQTRPNDTVSYTAYDVVGQNPGANVTFSNVSSVSGGHIIIQSACLEVDVAAVPTGMSSFRLHLYDAAPTVIADNAAYDLPSGDRAKYLGYIEFDTPIDLGATLWSQKDALGMKRKLAAGSTALYGILQTIGGFTPSASTVKSISLNVLEV